MKKIVFFASIYWDIHWMYNVIKKMNGVVHTVSDEVKNVCKFLEIPVVDSMNDFQIVVLTTTHVGQHRKALDYFLNTGGQVVVLQHAWDSSLSINTRFWGYDMSRFTFYCVGSDQDYNWLTSKWGEERIIFTGIPKLDDLYRIKKSKKSLQHIYDELGVDKFFLSIAPTDVVSQGIYYDYRDRLEGETNIPIVFKLHPGGNHGATKEQYVREGRNLRIIDDDRNNILKTYELIKASCGVICLESFISIEATLMEKPVIFYGMSGIPNNFYSREENINQIQRAPREMSSTFTDLKFTEKQKEIAEMYMFDGKNTDRVVEVLKKMMI